jgi:hypothetical protein
MMTGCAAVFDMAAGDGDSDIEGIYDACWDAAWWSGQEIACILPAGVSAWSISESSWMAALPQLPLLEPVSFYFVFVTAADVEAGQYAASAASLEVGEWQLPGQANRWAAAAAAVGAAEVPSTSSTVAPCVCVGPSGCEAHLWTCFLCKFCWPNILAKLFKGGRDTCEEAYVCCTLDGCNAPGIVAGAMRTVVGCNAYCGWSEAYRGQCDAYHGWCDACGAYYGWCDAYRGGTAGALRFLLGDGADMDMPRRRCIVESLSVVDALPMFAASILDFFAFVRPPEEVCAWFASFVSYAVAPPRPVCWTFESAISLGFCTCVEFGSLIRCTKLEPHLLH